MAGKFQAQFVRQISRYKYTSVISFIRVHQKVILNATGKHCGYLKKKTRARLVFRDDGILTFWLR